MSSAPETIPQFAVHLAGGAASRGDGRAVAASTPRINRTEKNRVYFAAGADNLRMTRDAGVFHVGGA